jgi:hypothetical protein
MTYLDKTFCASPNCKNDCGRKMNATDKVFLQGHPGYPVSFGYFRGKVESSHRFISEEAIKRRDNPIVKA